jgi:nitrate reductase assembly molybdenum cofactor insertion protein NarJ
MAARDDVQRLAAALERPREGYLARLETTRTTLPPACGDAARQLVVFIDRIADLTTEQLGELYDETFRRDPATTIEPLATRLARRRTRPEDAPAALGILASRLDRLQADRNPFEHLVRALCCALRARAEDPRLEPGDRA